jgi:hypothetical protein
MRHRFNFAAAGVETGGDVLTPEAWDLLRASDSPFGMSNPGPPELATRAEAILGVCERMGATIVCSYAVGTGALERLLADRVALTCTEYAPETVEALKRFLPRVERRDLRDGPIAGFGLHLLHRADAELTAREWREFFAATREPVLMVASSFLDLDHLKVEMIAWRRGYPVAGWARTERSFKRFLPGSARPIQIGDLTGFLIPAAARGQAG